MPHRRQFDLRQGKYFSLQVYALGQLIERCTLANLYNIVFHKFIFCAPVTRILDTDPRYSPEKFLLNFSPLILISYNTARYLGTPAFSIRFAR